MHIRAAHPTEYDRIAALIVGAYSEFDLEDGYRRSLGEVAQRASNGDVIVLEDADGSLIGTVTMSRAGTTLMESTRPGEVDFRLLAVSPTARRRGIARILVDHVVQMASQRGASGVFLHTGPEMLGAQQLYENLGFARVHHRDIITSSGTRLLSYYLPLYESALATAPAFQSWQDATAADLAPFTIPGHKRLGHHYSAPLGKLLDSDVPLYGGLDTVKLTANVLGRAERLGAELWGADFCRYSTGGSTHANQAAALVVGRPGDTVLVARNAHRSVLLGLVFAGLKPVWLPAEIHPTLGVPVGLSMAGLVTAIAQNPDAVAVFCVEPGYLGASSDLAAIVQLSHAAGMAVIVDQAWGAHFGFHPAYPQHALTAGADALITSAHKTLPAYSQGAILLARDGLLDADRLERAFDAGHMTSPAGSILASVDASRAILASGAGEFLLQRLVFLVADLRLALAAAGVRTLGPDDFAPGRFDPAKLVLLTAVSGHSGLDIERDLLTLGLPVEMADRDTVVPLISLLDTAESVGRLRDALLACISRSHGTPRPISPAAQWTHAATVVLSPAAAFFAPHQRLPAGDAIGRVSAELIAPYPPGIPLVMPGELLTAATVDALARAAASGARIAYAADPTLQTLQVIRD